MQTIVRTRVHSLTNLRHLLAALCVLATPFSVWAAPFAYIPNQNDHNVSIIDTANNMVVATVPVGSDPDGVAVTADGSRVYVANRGADTVSVIATASNTVVATVPVGSFPEGVAANPVAARVYVANLAADTVSVIATDSNTVVATVPVGSGPLGVAVNPAGTRAYVVNRGDCTVSVIDTGSNTVIATITLTAGDLSGVAVHPAGTRLYVTDVVDGTVVVIDTASNTVMATIAIVGSQLAGVAVNPAGTRLYVSNQANNTVAVIDTASNTVAATVPVGNYPTGVSVNPSGTAVYVANTDDNTVSAIDTTSNTVAATVPVGSLPSALGIFIGPALAPAPAPAPTPVPDPIPPLGGVPGVLGIGTQPTVLDLGKSQGPAMTNCLLATVRSLFGADVQYRGESPNGVVTFSLGDSTLSLYATQASIYTAQSLGIHVTDSNALTVVTSCGTFTIAPAVANLAEFGAVLNAMGLQANISAQGVITVVAGTTVYVARPDYVVTRSTASVAPGTPSLTRVADGSYRFTDSSGSVQALVPAFVDTGGLASQAPLALALGGWILIQTDGKALFTAFSGLQYVLTPDMTLTAAPAADAALLCWQDAPNHYLFRSSTLLQAQGFTALR